MYLKPTFWPAPLVFEYGTSWVNGAEAIVIEALLVHGLLTVTIYGLWRRTAVSFAGAWFFGILVPTSLAPCTTQMIVEHRMYLPLAGAQGEAWATRGQCATRRGVATRGVERWLPGFVTRLAPRRPMTVTSGVQIGLCP